MTQHLVQRGILNVAQTTPVCLALLSSDIKPHEKSLSLFLKKKEQNMSEMWNLPHTVAKLIKKMVCGSCLEQGV